MTIIPSPVWVEDYGVDWTEVSLDTANLLLEDGVEKTGIKLSYPCASRRDIHGLLTTTENNLAKRKKEKKRKKTKQKNKHNQCKFRQWRETMMEKIC